MKNLRSMMKTGSATCLATRTSLAILLCAALAPAARAEEGSCREAGAGTRAEAPSVTLCPGTAVEANVIAGKTFSSEAGSELTGTMVNRRGVTIVPGREDKQIPNGYHNGTGVCVGDPDLKADNIKIGVNLFGVWGTRRPSKPLKTGQTNCYDAAGLQVDCAGTGQDGELHRGATRVFKDNGDGTLWDQQSGLMWEKLSDDGSIHDKNNTYSWLEAVSVKIATLNATNFAGHDDWRMPNRFEMETMVNAGAIYPATYSIFNTGCAPGCTVTTCSCTQPDLYWTSTTYLYDPSAAWVLLLDDGGLFAYEKTSHYFVRAVRAGT